MVPGKADSSRLVVRVEREGADPFVLAWDDAGGSLEVDGLFPGAAGVQVLRFAREEGATEPTVEGPVTGSISLSATPVGLFPSAGGPQGDPSPTGTPAASGAGQGPRGAFIVVHLEVPSAPQVVARRWPNLERLVALADRYGYPLTLHVSWPWAAYAYDNGLLDTVRAWEAEGHEIGLHHHGPKHKFFDGYTDASEEIRTDGWYATRYPYQGTIADLMAFMAPLTERGITSASMYDPDAEEWPAGVLYYATDSGEDPSKEDLLSRPVETTHNGHPVVEIYNAGYEIDHLGSAAVTLEDVEGALDRAAPDEYLGLVFNDETLGEDFGLIEPLFQLFQERGVRVETVSTLLGER